MLPAEEIRCRIVDLLTDDLVIDVLCRIPPEDVLKCRQVCKRFRDLTSTKYFLDIHLSLHCNTTYPTLILGGVYNIKDKEDEDEDEVANYPVGRARFICKEVLIDMKLEEAFNRKKIANYPGNCFSYSRVDEYYYTRCCSHGLAVMKSETNFFVYNPVYHPQDRLSIFFPQSVFQKTEAMAVYFHPILKQYCILWAEVTEYPHNAGHRRRNDLQNIMKYKILILGSDPSWRNNNIIINTNNLWIHKFYKYTDHPMVLVDKYLYWLVNHPLGINNEDHIAIIEFDIINEELRIMSCPLISIPEIDHNRNMCRTCLLNVCGMLSMFFIPLTKYLTIYQWTLTDRRKELWTSRINIYAAIPHWDYDIKPIAFVDGELLIVSLSCFPRRYNVLHINEGKKKKLAGLGDGFCKFVPLVKSIASMKNYKSKINVGEMDN